MVSNPEIYAKFLSYECNAKNIDQYDDTYDTMQLLMRIAIPENETANNIYTNTTQKCIYCNQKMQVVMCQKRNIQYLNYQCIHQKM